MLIVFGVSAYLFWNNSYVVFKPLLFHNDSFEYINVDTSFNKNLKVVLESYGFSYKEDADRRILVKRKLKNDKELVWNLTERAMDPQWLNYHRNN